MISSIPPSKEMKYGIIKNLSIRFLMIREKLNIHYNKKKEYSQLYYLDNINNDKLNSQLISPRNEVELKEIYLPNYMELYEQSNNLLKEFEVELNKLKEEQQKRIVPSFNDVESKLIDQNIHMITEKMTQKLKKCKFLTKNLNAKLVECPIDDNIKINMYQNLLNRLAEASRIMQINEEKYFQKFQELNGFDENFFNSINNIKTTCNTINNYESLDTNQTQNLFMSNSAQKVDRSKERNKELDQMVITVNDLKTIYEEVSNMVIYQGTILDRIDYNIYQNRNNIRKGNREMAETHESLKSGCIQKINQILIIAIFIMSVLVIFKFF